MTDTPNTGLEVKKGRPLSFWIALVLGGLLGLSVLFNLALFVAVAAGSAQKDKYQETLISGGLVSADKILCIPVYGLIMKDSSPRMFGEKKDLPDSVVDALERAAKDTHIKAIILDINSPGGGITDCDRIYNELLRFRKARPEVKIVASMGDVAASGGYYISMAADRVVAAPTTITGSIGVIMGTLNIEKLMSVIGVQEVIFKSGPKKDIFSAFRKMTDEEKEIAQSIIDEMYQRFVGIVGAGRKNLDEKQIRTLADGRIYTGQQALANGLVDELGDFKDALEITKKLANLKDARVIKYKRHSTIFDLFETGVQNLKPEVKLLPESGTLSLDTPRFMYLWTVK